jgi:hypothetical protein
MEATAGRFLRSDATRGSVDVDTGKDVYQTQLVRDASRVALRVARPTGLQAGTWSVIGFPPVRGASLRESPPSGRESMRLPVVDDIVPMIGRDSDGRLDDIRQWILGLSMTIDGSTSSAVDRRKARQTRDSFFKILDSLMPDLIVEFARIDQRSWQVIVRTQDGEMPLDLVSQGTSSIIGWVGTLLQRLQEINQDSGNPTQARAIVLIDEIDAHMHPEWQKTLVPLLKDNFPNVQFIATTHSPLVAGAMEEQEVIRLVRVGAAIEARGVGERLRGLRADQILTSRAFDLETTTDFRTDELQAEYSGLLAIPDRSDSQESAFRALSARVRRNLAPIGDSFEARLQSRKRDEELEARERSLEPEERRAISKELSRILQEATKALGLPAADAREESRDGASMSDLEVLAADDEPVDDDAAEVAEIDGGAGITENDDDATAGADGGTRSAGGMA